MTDPVIPATDDELLRLEYVPLDLAMLWDDNKKIHDTGQLIASIERYGFKDPPKYVEQLQRLAGDNLLPVSVAQDDLALLGTLASGVPFPETADEEDDADDPAPGYDTIRVKVYRFAQIKDMVAAIRELISEHGWEADVEVPAT